MRSLARAFDDVGCDDRGVIAAGLMVRQSKAMPGVEKAQALFMKNFSSQLTHAWSNFQSLATEVGGQALPV